MNLESRKTKDLADLARIINVAEEEDRQRQAVKAMEEVHAETKEDAGLGQGSENIQIDTEGIEPEVTQEFEKSKEKQGVYRWENGDGKTFKPLLKQIDRIALEELTKAQIKKYAEEIAKGNYPSKQKSIEFFNQHEQEIDKEVQIIKAEANEAALKKNIGENFSNSEKSFDGAEKKTTSTGRTRFSGIGELEKNPRIPNYRYVKTEVAPASKVSESKAAEPVAPKEDKPIMPKEAPRFATVEAHAKSGQPTIISEGAPKPREVVEKPVVERSEPKPEPKITAEKLQTPAAAFEPRGETNSEIKELDGLVEFNLGKFGIIDARDTKEARGLKMAELRREIPEFFSLSPQEQLYTLEKLSQKKSHDLDIETKNAIKEADAGNKKGGILGRFARKLTKTGRTATLRRQTVENMKKNGLASYKEELQGIARFTKARDKKIVVDEKGMVIKFVGREGVSDKHKELIAKFNRAATAFAETPYVHTTGDLTPLEILTRNKFKNAEKAFESARAELLKFESKGLEPLDMKEKLLEFSNMDDDMRLNQAYSYDAKDLYGDATVWNKMGKIANDYKITEKGGYALAGFAARGLGKYALGLGGGAVASAFIGGARGWISKRQEFKELAERKRSGDNVKGKEALGVKEVIDGSSYASKIDKLISDIEKAKGPKRDALIQSLQNRVMVARERDELGLVNFGKANKEFAAKDAFFRSLKNANRILLETDPETMKVSDAVAERMQSLYFKDEIKDVEKKKAIKKSIMRGAIAGGTFFVGGAMANDLAFHNGEMTKGAIKEMSEMTDKALGELKEFAHEVNAAANIEFAKVGRFAVDAVDGNSAMNPEVGGINKPDFHKIEVVTEIPRLEQTFSMVGGRGAIGAIDDLQAKLLARYGENMPENLKAFMSAKPEKLAIDWGFYRPGEEAESAAIMKGAKFGITNEGQITFEDHEGHSVRLDSGTEKFAGRMYDGGAKNVAPVVDETPTVDFADTKAEHTAAGWDHQNSGTGEIFSKEIPMQSGMNGAHSELLASTSGAPAAAETIGTISGVPPEGMSVSTPEIRGTVIAKYDDFGRVTRMEWAPQSRIEEVVKFKATPDKFLVDDLEHSGLKYPTRSFGTSELRNGEMTKYCIKYLELRNMLRSGGFQPGSTEYNYLTGQMRLVGSAIEGRSGAIFRPIQEDGILRGLKTPRMENIPTVPRAPGIPAEPDIPAAKEAVPSKEMKFKPFSEAVPTTGMEGKLVNIDVPGVRGQLEFLKDANGKFVSLAPGPIKTPYDADWQKFLADDWREKAVRAAKALGKDESAYVNNIQKMVRSYIGYETLARRGGLSGTFPEGQAILERQVDNIVSKYGAFMKDEEFDKITASIEAKS